MNYMSRPQSGIGKFKTSSPQHATHTPGLNWQINRINGINITNRINNNRSINPRKLGLGLIQINMD